MAKLGARIARRKIKAMRGIADVYHHKRYGWIVRAWPRPHSPSMSNAWQRTSNAMREANAYFKTASPAALAAWRLTQPTGARTWADMLRSSALSAPDNEFRIHNFQEVTCAADSATTIRLTYRKDPAEIHTTRDTTKWYGCVHTYTNPPPLIPKLYAATPVCPSDPAAVMICPTPPVPPTPTPVGPCQPSFDVGYLLPPGRRPTHIYTQFWGKNNNGHARPTSGYYRTVIPPYVPH